MNRYDESVAVCYGLRFSSSQPYTNIDVGCGKVFPQVPVHENVNKIMFEVAGVTL